MDGCEGFLLYLAISSIFLLTDLSSAASLLRFALTPKQLNTNFKYRF